MTQTLFFDLDGTLTDPFLGITRCIQFALDELGAEVPEAEDLAWCIGPPLLENFRGMVGDAQAERAVTLYRERFATRGLYENTPYAGIHEELSKLKNAGRRLCVASSKPGVYVRQILEHFELSGYFDGIFGSELDGRRTDKAELLAFALAQTATHANQATMIGDRRHDIIGARANGLASLAVLYGYGSREELEAAGAERFATTPNELSRHLL